MIRIEFRIPRENLECRIPKILILGIGIWNENREKIQNAKFLVFKNRDRDLQDPKISRKKANYDLKMIIQQGTRNTNVAWGKNRLRFILTLFNNDTDSHVLFREIN